jgi:hypothetical protein
MAVLVVFALINGTKSIVSRETSTKSTFWGGKIAEITVKSPKYYL